MEHCPLVLDTCVLDQSHSKPFSICQFQDGHVVVSAISFSPDGIFISLFSIGCVVLIVGWYDLREKGAVTVLRFYLDQIWRLLVSIIAPVILFLQFFLRRDWNAEAQHVSKLDLWNDLLHLKALITLSNQERIILLLLSIMILSLFTLTLFQRIRKKAFVRYDGFMLLFLSVLSLFIFPPTSFQEALRLESGLGYFRFYVFFFGSPPMTSVPAYVMEYPSPQFCLR